MERHLSVMSRKSVLLGSVISSFPESSEFSEAFDKKRSRRWFSPYCNSVGIVCETNKENSKVTIKTENSEGSRRFLVFFISFSIFISLLAVYLDRSLASILIVVMGFSVGGIIWISFLIKTLHSFAEKFVQETLDQKQIFLGDIDVKGSD